MLGAGMHAHGQQLRKHVLHGKRLGMVRAVAADLPEGPSSGRLDVVFWFAHEGVQQRRHALKTVVNPH